MKQAPRRKAMNLFQPAPDFFPFQGSGTVDRTVQSQNPGRVYFQATYWPTRLANSNSPQPLPPGSCVQVLGRDGLTLFVQPVNSP